MGKDSVPCISCAPVLDLTQSRMQSEAWTGHCLKWLFSSSTPGSGEILVSNLFPSVLHACPCAAFSTALFHSERGVLLREGAETLAVGGACCSELAGQIQVRPHLGVGLPGVCFLGRAVSSFSWTETVLHFVVLARPTCRKHSCLSLPGFAHGFL